MADAQAVPAARQTAVALGRHGAQVQEERVAAARGLHCVLVQGALEGLTVTRTLAQTLTCRARKP
jgi:hypothetical protein